MKNYCEKTCHLFPNPEFHEMHCKHTLWSEQECLLNILRFKRITSDLSNVLLVSLWNNYFEILE